MTDHKSYNRMWMRKRRWNERKEEFLKKGQCPVCGMVLKPEYSKFHDGCPYLKQISIEIFSTQIGFIDKDSV